MKDLVKDPRLITQRVPRISEKSGTYNKSVASPGHLLTLVGVLSGIGAIVGGTVGRIGKDNDESGGFNWLGKVATAFANAVPAFGIMFNAKEVMANPLGLPHMYRDLNGSDQTYNPRYAGQSQIVAGAGFLAVPWFGLHNKYVASLFDIFNGFYFLGAAEEEKPNINMLGRSILRKSHEFYTNIDQEHNRIDFSKEAELEVSQAA